MKAAAFLERLEGVRSRGPGRWSTRCPAHADRSPSLSVCEVENKILVHCFSGCEPRRIVGALGLAMVDLFTDSPSTPNQQPAVPPQKLNFVEVAFRFELGALDRRLRADAILNAAQNFHLDELSDRDLDRILNTIARAYLDRERAKFLETVADDLRMKACQERIAHHAA